MNSNQGALSWTWTPIYLFWDLHTLKTDPTSQGRRQHAYYNVWCTVTISLGHLNLLSLPLLCLLHLFLLIPCHIHHHCENTHTHTHTPTSTAGWLLLSLGLLYRDTIFCIGQTRVQEPKPLVRTPLSANWGLNPPAILSREGSPLGFCWATSHCVLQILLWLLSPERQAHFQGWELLPWQVTVERGLYSQKTCQWKQIKNTKGQRPWLPRATDHMWPDVGLRHVCFAIDFQFLPKLPHCFQNPDNTGCVEVGRRDRIERSNRWQLEVV